MTAVRVLASRAKKASRDLAASSHKQRVAFVKRLARIVRARRAAILRANATDVRRARRKKVAEHLLDRLLLDSKRLEAAAGGLEDFAKRADVLGKVIDSWTTEAGLRIRKVRVPLGVVALVFEARPLVCLEAAAIAVKSGNALLLRGSSLASGSNRALHACIRKALDEAGLPPVCVGLVDSRRRGDVEELLSLHGLVDVVIPRGGADFIAWVRETAQVSVIETGAGNCHVYVDASADLRKALRILVNAKTQRPSVCNAAEKLLVHRRIAKAFVPQAVRALRAKGVVVRGCPVTRKLVRGLLPAAERDWFREYLGLEIAVKVVDSVEDAVRHINKYSTAHSDAIVSRNKRAVAAFFSGVDSAVVYANASTRFSDGGCFGFGGEVGISTQKLHARGPMAERELTAYKYLVKGSGQVRA